MRLRSVTAGAIVLTLAGAAPAAAEPGDPYVNSCNSLQTIPNCTPDVLGEATTVEVSPDGKHVYLATSSPITSILLFDRTQTGAITRRAGPLGCVTNGGGGGCAQATNMTMAWDMAFSPNGQQLYYSSFANGALLIFDRNPDTGVLTQRTGAAGCFAPSTSGCTVRSGSGSAFAVIASPDGRSVYLKTQTGIAVFSRGTSGQLDQLACVEETLVSPCIDAVGLSDQGYRLAMSPDSRHLYVPFTNPGGVAVFNRNTTTGLLTQVPGLSGGCISSSGESSSQPGACVPGGESLSQLLAAGIDPQGNFVYAGGTGGITVYRRDPANGLLTKVECLNEDGNFGCKDVTGVALTIDFAFAPDDVGPGLISSSVVSSLAFFHRNPATGALTQHTAKACLRGPIIQPPCEQAPGLTGISRVALAPGGLDLYATGRDNGALLAIERDFAPQCEPATLTATSGTAVASRCGALTPTSTRSRSSPWPTRSPVR